jgi:DNA-binding CsgD family transcriptional regulator
MPSIFPEEIDLGGKSELTRRETQILNYVALGFTNQEIGELLSIGMETVKTHSKNMLMKMGARTRAHLVTLAWERGMLTTRSLNATRIHFREYQKRYGLERKRARAVQ